MKKVEHFFIVTNENKDRNLELTRAIRDYMVKKGATCEYYVSNDTNWAEDQLSQMDLNKEGVECVLVLGGDGTLVRASRDLVDYGIPLIGVNLGTLGYLCELERRNVFEAINQIMRGEYMIENRMMLEGFTLDQPQKKSRALNDVVIHRMGSAQIIRITVSVDGEYLSVYDADGIILATPTGSTGYNLSAGGPIVDPKADMILITPINSHGLDNRSIVVGADSVIDITMSMRRAQADEQADMSFDGDGLGYLLVGDTIRIQKAKVGTKILKLNNQSFLQILQKKMQTLH